MSSQTNVDERAVAAAQAAGLRALADLIETSPDASATEGYLDDLNIWHATSADRVAAIARAGKAHGAVVTKEYDDVFTLTLDFGGGVVARCLANRSTVCERVVTGTEEITRTVPDPEALATVPQIQVTETVETVEWRCEPILAAKGEVPAT